MMHAGAQLRGRCRRAPPPAFHTLARDMSLNRGATHFTLGLSPSIISSFLLQVYLRPSRYFPVAPLILMADIRRITNGWNRFRPILNLSYVIAMIFVIIKQLINDLLSILQSGVCNMLGVWYLHCCSVSLQEKDIKKWEFLRREGSKQITKKKWARKKA